MNSIFKNKNKYTALIVIAIYFLIHLIILQYHELWRDEAQAYLLVKNTSLVELFKILRIEGHPIGWFLYIYLFSKLGISFYYFGLISLFSMTLAAYFFLRKSPFPLWLKIVVLFSGSFLYYNAVISRVYCLCVLFTVLTLSYYKERYEKPVPYLIFVALILQTHIKMSGLAIGLMLDYILGAFKKHRNKIKYVIIPFISLLLVVAELLPYGEYRPFFVISDQMNSVFVEFLFKAKRGIKRIFESSFGNDNGRIIIAATIALFTVLCYIFYQIIKEKRIKNYIGVSIVVACGFGAYYIITAYIYGLHRQMASMLTTMVMAFAWMIEYQEENKVKYASRVILIAFILFSSRLVVKDMIDDIKHVYSYGEETSKYIVSNLEDDSVILLSHDPLNPLIISLVESDRKDILFYDLDHMNKYTIHLLNEVFEEASPNKIVYGSDRFKEKNVYYLCRRQIDDKRIELVYSNLDKPTIGSEEHFSIYRIKINQN